MNKSLFSELEDWSRTHSNNVQQIAYREIGNFQRRLRHPAEGVARKAAQSSSNVGRPRPLPSTTGGAGHVRETENVSEV